LPKYRFRVLKGSIAEEVVTCIRIFSEQLGCEIIEMNIQVDHVHLLVMVPPKVSVSGFAGTIKGRTAIRILNKFRKLKEKPYWGNHLWVRGYCVDTVGLDSEMIRRYVKYQEAKEKVAEKPQY
jgi:putative transposase